MPIEDFVQAQVERVVFEVQLSCLHAALYTAAIECLSYKQTPSQSECQKQFCTIADNLKYIFEKIEAYNDARAEEEAQLFKNRTQTVHFQTDEEVEEASYKAMFPDHSLDFADLEDLDFDEKPENLPIAATDSQVHSAQSQSLTSGTLLKDIVQLHRTVFDDVTLVQVGNQEFDVRYAVAQKLLQVIDWSVNKTFDASTISGPLLSQMLSISQRSCPFQGICIVSVKPTEHFQRSQPSHHRTTVFWIWSVHAWKNYSWHIDALCQ